MHFLQVRLGHNEALEEFPVGRRLAFDARKGRLRVVCRRCERWNLTPLEERWEAIEQAESRFRATRQRVSTENIGLARLRDGTELVRIGDPLRPEFAAWRYGDQFGRRRRRQPIVAGFGLGACGAVLVGGALAGVAVTMFGGAFASRQDVIAPGGLPQPRDALCGAVHGVTGVETSRDEFDRSPVIASSSWRKFEPRFLFPAVRSGTRRQLDGEPKCNSGSPMRSRKMQR